MRSILLSLLALATASSVSARTITVSTSTAPSTLRAAAQLAVPGDTILFSPGVYAGGDYIERLQGRPDAWITIVAGSPGEVVLRGGGNSWHLVDPAYLRIEGFVIEGQTANGLNIDDAGSFDTPAHHVEIVRCTWRGIAAAGNNDQLKLSGVDSFLVQDCVFLDGSPGGSMIDMVGCHNGRFVGNRFERAGSNAIQAKGGTQWITVERNTFLDGGARGINIGGSTDTLYFRPQTATFEASHIYVHANLFVASDAPFAFVGAVQSEVVNNTIIAPRRWAFRILQETTLPRFQQCGDNTLRNNVFVLGAAPAGYTVNIGPNTRPSSFVMENNLWHNTDDASWRGPSLPVAETGAVLGDPLLTGAPADVTPAAGSPAVGTGATVARPERDLYGRVFATPRSIGAAERPVSAAAPADRASRLSVAVVDRVLCVRQADSRTTRLEAIVVDTRGELVLRADAEESATVRLDLSHAPAGPYLVVIRTADSHQVFPMRLR